MISATKGEFKSISIYYGNGRDESIKYWLSKGWAVYKEVFPDYGRGDKIHYITFVAGENAIYPNSSNDYWPHYNFTIL